jgi:hypothetical protein
MKDGNSLKNAWGDWRTAVRPAEAGADPAAGNQDTTQRGGTVIRREIGAGIAGSWIRRAGNDTPQLTSADGEFRSTVASVPGEAPQGWDPWEIWLCRIDQPRRSRAENELQHGPVL